MKSVVLCALLWMSSTLWIGLAAGREEQMARTLRTWSLAALLICLGMQLLWRDNRELGEPWGRQVKSAILAFAMFAVCSSLWVGTLRLIRGTQLAPDLTAIGSLLLPGLALIAIMALEFDSLRSHAIAIGVLFATATFTFGFMHFLMTKKPSHPGVIRIHQPAHKDEWMRYPIVGTRS